VSTVINFPQVPVEEFTLANGLRVVMSEDHAVPVVSVAVYYNVGSRNECEGRTGFAHLFEHMMFQGSENVPKAAHFQYIFNAGGTMNGTTSSERTNYFETLPASQLPLALWLESDRMRSLKVTQENLDNQRNAVQEEKRLTYDNRPYANAFLRLHEMTFVNPANAHSTIGSMEDLDAATIDDIREFFRIYYAPNNAVLTIVGDFDPREARSLVERYFGSIPNQPLPPAVDVTEPPEVAQRTDTYADPFAQLPALMLSWKIPPRRTPDFYALQLAADLLFEGDSSRLYQKLVKEEESAVAVQGGVDERRGPSSIYLVAIPKPEHTMAAIRESVGREIERLAAEGPTEREMEKLRNNLLNDAVRSRQSSLFRAQMLAEYALYDGDPQLVNSELERYYSVTPAGIKTAVAQYLTGDNKVTVEIIPSPPTAGAGDGAGGATPSASAQTSDAPTPPGEPPPQIPARPPLEPASPTEPSEAIPSGSTEQPPAERPQATDQT
jgi:predicted Zn-dependent peptidase